MFTLDKRVLNILVIICLSFITFYWTFFIFHQKARVDIILGVICIRIVASFLIYKDYSLSWSKATQRTFLIKSIVYIAAFVFYLPIYYGSVRFAFLRVNFFCIFFV